MAPEARRLRSNRAAAAAASSTPPCLPDDVLRAIATRLYDSEDCAALRLAHSSFVRATAPLIHTISVRAWPKPMPQRVRLTGARRLDADLGRAAGATWRQLQQLVGQLQALRSLHISGEISTKMPGACAAALSRLVRLDLHVASSDSLPFPTASSVVLPSLRAASVVAGSHTLQLSDVARLAPNVEQLHCSALELVHAGGGAAEVSLPAATHYGGCEVHVLGLAEMSEAEAAAVFAAALPNLRVVACLPKFGFSNKGRRYQRGAMLLPAQPLPPQPLDWGLVLSHCSCLEAVRALAEPPLLARGTLPHLARLGSLRRLALDPYGDHTPVALCNEVLCSAEHGIRLLTQLEFLHLRMGKYGGLVTHFFDSTTEVIKEVARLPSLRGLALPMDTLGWPGCEELAGNTRLAQLTLVHQYDDGSDGGTHHPLGARDVLRFIANVGRQRQGQQAQQAQQQQGEQQGQQQQGEQGQQQQQGEQGQQQGEQGQQQGEQGQQQQQQQGQHQQGQQQQGQQQVQAGSEGGGSEGGGSEGGGSEGGGSEGGAALPTFPMSHMGLVIDAEHGVPGEGCVGQTCVDWLVLGEGAGDGEGEGVWGCYGPYSGEW